MAAAHRALAPAWSPLVPGGLALPYLTGQVLQPGSFTRGARLLVPGGRLPGRPLAASRPPSWCPATAHGIYLWGDPIDDPLEPLASSPWAERSLVPYGGAGSQVFLDTAEDAIESGQRVPGLAAYLARAGIRYVVVRNDLSPAALGYTPPRLVHQTLALSGFRRVASFGPLVTGAQTNPAQRSGRSRPTCRSTRRSRSTRRPARPCGRPRPVGRAPGRPAPCWSTAGRTRCCSWRGRACWRGQPAVIAGDPLAGRPALWAVTDGQRRADNASG